MSLGLHLQLITQALLVTWHSFDPQVSFRHLHVR